VIENGVDVHKKDESGATPLIQAAKDDNVELIELLAQYVFFNCVFNFKKAGLYLFCRKGVDIQAVDLGGKNAVNHAVELNNREALKKLLNLGVKVLWFIFMFFILLFIYLCYR